MKQLCKTSILIDTKPLCLLLIGLVDQEYICKFDRTKEFTINDFKKLTSFLKNYSSFSTTHYILCEAMYFTAENKNLKPIYKDRIYKIVTSLLHRYSDFDQTPNTEIIFESNCINIVGTSDCSLLEASRSNDIPFLTSDLVLYSQASRNKVDAFHFLPVVGVC